MATPDTRYATPKEVAATMHVHRRTVTKWAERGEIAAQRLPGGRHWRIAVDDSGWALAPSSSAEQ